MKHSQTKAPQDIICNSQETSNIFGTKHDKNNRAVLAKRQYYFNERMKLILQKSRNNLPKIWERFTENFDRCPWSFRYFY